MPMLVREAEFRAGMMAGFVEEHSACAKIDDLLEFAGAERLPLHIHRAGNRKASFAYPDQLHRCLILIAGGGEWNAIGVHGCISNQLALVPVRRDIRPGKL